MDHLPEEQILEGIIVDIISQNRKRWSLVHSVLSNLNCIVIIYCVLALFVH